MSIYSSKEYKIEKLASIFLVGLSRTVFTGNKIKDFYNATASDIKSKSFSSLTKELNLEMGDITEKELKEALSGRIVKTMGKFPTENTTSYGMITASLHFKGDNMILGGKDFRYTAGDPNFYRSLS